MRLCLEDAGRRGPQQSPEPKGLYKETLEQNLSWARQGEVCSQEEGVESYLPEAKCNRRRGSEEWKPPRTWDVCKKGSPEGKGWPATQHQVFKVKTLEKPCSSERKTVQTLGTALPG